MANLNGQLEFGISKRGGPSATAGNASLRLFSNHPRNVHAAPPYAASRRDGASLPSAFTVSDQSPSSMHALDSVDGLDDSAAILPFS